MPAPEFGAVVVLPVGVALLAGLAIFAAHLGLGIASEAQIIGGGKFLASLFRVVEE